MNVGQIPWTAIEAYARRLGVEDPDEFETLVKMIRVCDNVLLAHVKQKSEKAGA